MTATPNRRAAFTLVEMLVASALIIFMMYIIASAFESGLTSFRVLKAQGDMQEKLRNVANAIRMDLTAPHFGGPVGVHSPIAGPYLQDQRLNDQTWTPSEKGYVRISQPFISNDPALVNATEMTAEGLDPDGTNLLYYGLNPNRAPNNLYMQFTVNLTDGHPATRDARGRRDQFFSTDAVGLGGMSPWGKPDYTINDTPLSSQWAEVTYFVARNGQTTDGVTPLYTLFRRQKLLVEPSATAPAWLPSPPDPNDPLYRRMNPPDPSPSVSSRSFPRVLTDRGEKDTDFPDVSTWYTGQPATTNLGAYVFNSPASVTEPVRRFGMSPGSWAAVVPNPPWTSTSNTPPAYGQAQRPLFSASPPMMEPFNTLSREYGDNYANPRVGGDVLVTDLVNVEIKVLWEPVRGGDRNTDRFNPFFLNDVTKPSPNSIEPAAAGNPDYPFDQLPVGINVGINGQSPPPRVFDTWSSNNDPLGSQYVGVSAAVPFFYGVDPNTVDERDNVPVMEKSFSTSDPNYANWNAGHFLLPPKQLPPRQPTPPASVPRWKVVQGGSPQQPITNIPTQYGSVQGGTNIPLRVRVRAVQIKLRLWDRKSSQTRQVTIIQDL